mgnify:CR=1 FL=1
MTTGKPYLIVVFLLVASIGFSQQSAIYTNDLVKFNKALELYNNEQYLAAQKLFADVKEQATDEKIKGDCAYYVANAAVRLNQPGADELMERFVSRYPTSTKTNSAYHDVATYYFNTGKYPQARKWYDMVDEKSMSRADLEKYYFNKGYVYFQTNDLEQAKNYFNRVVDSEQYGAQAKYYIGYMAYESDDYDQANQYFDEVKGDERYGKELSYYQADMNFKLGNFEKAIQLGKEQLPKSNVVEKSQLNKIIGESYFNLKQYDQAIPYLKEYQGVRRKWNNTDYYQLGYAYYKQGDYANAISEFNKIIDGKIDFFDQKIKLSKPEDAIKQGIVMIPEDRRKQGLVFTQNTRSNISITDLKKVSKNQIINSQKESLLVKELIELLDIRPNQIDGNISFYSGGNQQKVLFAKWIFSSPKLILLDEPTRGIDIGAKRKIYELINNLSEKGVSILLVSSELEEVMGLADRAYLVKNGKTINEIIPKDTSIDDVLFELFDAKKELINE